MTERFEVPSLSEEAKHAAYKAWQGGYSPLRSAEDAMSVDVPRIVRAEVERALRNARHGAALPPEWDGLHSIDHIYLRKRFGEPAEGRCRCWDDTPERTQCPKHPWHPTEPIVPRNFQEAAEATRLREALANIVAACDSIDREIGKPSDHSLYTIEVRRIIAARAALEGR